MRSLGNAEVPKLEQRTLLRTTEREITPPEVNEKPTEAELNEIVAAIRSGDRLKATSLYISSTNKSLAEGQQFVRTLTEKLNAEEK